MAMNTGKIITAGLAAGLVMNVIEYAINGVLLAPNWEGEARRLGLDMSSQAQTRAIIGWVTVTFLLGIVIAWLYAAIRPRYGPGPRTALKAAFAAWLIQTTIGLSFWFTGLYPRDLVVMTALGSLIANVAGALVAGKIYSET